jgi:hypothetical protein
MGSAEDGWGTGPHVKLSAAMAAAAGGSGTTAASNFFAAHMELMGFLNYVAFLPPHIDGVLDDLGGPGGDEKSKPSKVFQRGLDPFRRLFGEVLISRAVDSYLTYISELLSLVFRERPETLRSKEQIGVDFVLGFDSIEELQGAIAERRVERLAYRGMAELADWVKDSMGFTLVTDRDTLRAIESLVEKRNLIVHHRGVIDHRFIRKCGTAHGDVGDVLNLREDAEAAFIVLSEVVWDADKRAASKWELERNPLPAAARPAA